jgi:hypothetical protein
MYLPWHRDNLHAIARPDVLVKAPQGSSVVFLIEQQNGENLNAKVIVFVGSMNIVVAIYLTAQDAGGRSWGLRLAGHLEFVLRNWLETKTGFDWLRY